MGSFDTDRAALAESYATAEDRIAVLLDGQAPAAKPAPAAAPAAAPSSAPKADTGPGFWSRLGSGLAAVAKNTGNLAADVASRIEVRPISSARTNAAADLPMAPRREPPWAWILAGAALVLVAILGRR